MDGEGGIGGKAHGSVKPDEGSINLAPAGV